MTPDRLREIIAAGESLDVEFKGEERERISDEVLVDAVVCLSNRPGSDPAFLLLGVEDDRRVTGARHRHVTETDPRRVEAMIAHRTRPAVSTRVDVVSLDRLPVVVIEVPTSRSPVATAAGKAVRRALGGDGRPACVPFFFHEMQGRQADLGLGDVSATVFSAARWSDLDPLEFARLRRTIRESSGRGDASLLDLSDFEIAKALGAVEGDREPERIRLLGVLLFGTEAAVKGLIPTHEVAFQDLTGTEVGTNDFFRWPLVRVVDEILGRYRARVREREVIVGMQRVGVPDYPERAVREALANALIHRDYTMLGAVHVQWNADRLEISNPGGFPEGVRLDNLLVTPPRPRNPLLADAFKRAGIVERSGRGIDTIFEEQLRTGRPAPSYQRSNAQSVVVALPGGEANLEFVKLVVERAATLRPLKAEGLLLLNGLWLDRRLDVPGSARLIQKPDREARAVLERLVESGLVEARGERDRTYVLSAGVYRRLGNVPAYVRQRDGDPLRREEKVLEHVAKFGRIARGDVMTTCGIEGKEAQALLAGLVSKGALERHGERRWTYYVLAKPGGPG